MERVEATFIKHFANANRTKAMNILRPQAKRERHRTTFSTGKRSVTCINGVVSFKLCGAYEEIGYRFLGWMRFFSYSGSCCDHPHPKSFGKGRPEGIHEYYVPSL